jgi:enoyl-CoA hydratase
MRQDYSFLEIEVADGVALVTMNKPEADNKFTPTEREEFATFLDEAGPDDDIRSVVLTGAGDAFCLGGEHSNDPFDPLRYYERLRMFVRKFIDFDKPMIMAMNGDARGLGWTVALTGDIIVVEEQVTFSDAQVRSGKVSATGPFLWPLSAGLLNAKRYLLTGDEFDAATAVEMGLVTEMVGRGKSVDKAMAYAKQIAAYRPETVQATKRSLNQWLRMNIFPVLDHGLALEFMSFPEAYAESTRGGSA